MQLNSQSVGTLRVFLFGVRDSTIIIVVVIIIIETLGGAVG
jgi:phage-related holin